ncbi:MAG: penicillin-binding protein activator, partial [Promethearchaeota archaeon]
KVQIMNREDKMRKGIVFSLVTIFFISLVFFQGCGKKEENEVIKIGILLPLTGNISFIGENFKNGMLLAYNESDAELKNRIKFDFGDHKNSVKEAVSLFRKYSQDKNIKAIVPTLTSVTNAILPLNEQNPKVLIGSIISGSDMPDKSKWLFRYFLSTNDEVEAMLGYFRENGIKEMGVLYVNDDYGLDAKQTFINQFQGKILLEESYDKNSSDFKNLVPKIKNITNLYILGYGQSYGILVKQLRTFGYDGRIFCFSSFSTPVVLESAGEFAQGIVFTATKYSERPRSEKIQEFYDSYLKTYSKDPDHYSLYGYDIAKLVIKTIEEIIGQNIEMNNNNIRNTIIDFGIYDGLFGKTEIKENGDFKFQEIKLFKVNNENKIVEVK